MPAAYCWVGFPYHTVGFALDRAAQRIYYFEPEYGLFSYPPSSLEGFKKDLNASGASSGLDRDKLLTLAMLALDG